MAKVNCIVYALTSSAEPTRVRYIGQTTQGLRRRLTTHIVDARNSAYLPVHRWINKTRTAGREVMATPIIENAAHNLAEMQVIAFYRRLGINLLNLTDGGRGVVGVPRGTYTPERGRAQSERQRGTKHTPEAIALMRAAHLGKRLSPEHRAKIGAAIASKPFKNRRPGSDEYRRGQAERMRQIWAMRREAHNGKS